MLKIAICEDEKLFAEDLEKGIQSWAAQRGIRVSIRKFTNGVPLIHCIEDNGMFDLVFMDVQMKKMDGLEAAAKIRENDYITSIIFVSQYEDYYKEAYSVHPFHFLNKPVEQEKLFEVMDAYMKMRNSDVEVFTYSVNKAMHVIKLSEVLYFYSRGRKISIISRDGNRVFNGKLADIQQQLENKTSQFIRIHQSYLVNARYVKEYYYKELIMANDERIYISKGYRKQVGEIHRLLMDR